MLSESFSSAVCAEYEVSNVFHFFSSLEKCFLLFRNHLFNAYDFRVVRPDKLTEIKNWGSNIIDDGESETGSEIYYNNEVEEVLIIEAFGVCDNEVFARAWCSYWGLAALVADVDKTCVACAVREAYAASIKVVILNCARLNVSNEVEDVDRTILEV